MPWGDELLKLKVELLNSCLLLGGCTDKDVKNKAVHIRYCDQDVSFDNSYVYGEDIIDENFPESNTDYYQLFYYKLIAGTHEKLIARVVRQGRSTSFYYVDTDGLIQYYNSIVYGDDSYFLQNNN